MIKSGMKSIVPAAGLVLACGLALTSIGQDSPEEQPGVVLVAGDRFRRESDGLRRGRDDGLVLNLHVGRAGGGGHENRQKPCRFPGVFHQGKEFLL